MTQESKSIGRTDRLLLILTGFIVLLVPLWFFNNIMTTAIERTRESSLSLLREELLQTGEKVRLALKPENYVEKVLREVHRGLMPEVTTGLMMMLPDKDFGSAIFDASLPAKILQSLRRHNLDAILVHVDSPEFEKYHYWHSEELQKQCKEPDALALSLSFTNFLTATELYQKRHIKLWKRTYDLPANIQKAFAIDKRISLFTYLTRFNEMLGVHDRVDEFYTDYFSQQSIYRYSYCCISSVNLHGAYTVIVPQKAVKPSELLKSALHVEGSNCTIALVARPENQPVFVVTDDGADYHIRAPSEFWNQLQLSDELFFPNTSRKAAGFAIKISGRHHSSIRRLEAQLRWFRLSGALLLLAYCATAFYLWLFGRQLRFSARRKLAMILGLIVILPVLGVGALTFLALQSSGRVIENHLVQFTQNNVHQMALFDEENQLRKMGAGIEVKRRLEADTVNDNELFASLARPGDNLDWFLTWTNSISECHDNGVLNQYSGFRLPSPANRLVQSLLDKYMDSLGLFKSGTRSDLSRTMTLGLLENYLTPALEEACIVHEGTLQRELTHSADTSMANLLAVKSGSGRYRLMYHRVSGLGEHVNRYLSRLAEQSPGWFVRRGLYGEVRVGVRLRKVADLLAFAWPADSLLSPAMDFSFERAMSLRDQGQGVIKHNGELEVRAWRYEDGRSAVIAAIGKSDGVRLAFSDLAIKMLFPVLAGYAILLLYFVTSVIVEFINGPVRIINKGVKALSHENYGVMLAGFSEDEFTKVTTAFNEMSIALKQREMMKRYVSGDLIEKFATTGSVAGETRMARVAVLASDIRSFTAIGEKYSPAEVVDMLNSYFTSMEEAISEHGGFIDKYIGDAVQAVFYDDAALDNYVLRACRAAMQMRRHLAALNAARRKLGLFTIENGIGIDCGQVVSGSIGSESGRKDFTVIGRVIEQAAALEALTVNTESRILISVAAMQTAGPAAITRDFNSAAVELCDV